MKRLSLIAVLLAIAFPAAAQSPRLYAPNGTFLGNVNSNQMTQTASVIPTASTAALTLRTASTIPTASTAALTPRIAFIIRTYVKH